MGGTTAGAAMAPPLAPELKRDDAAHGLAGLTALGIEGEDFRGDGDVRRGWGVVIDRDFQINGGGGRGDLGRGQVSAPMGDMNGLVLVSQTLR